MQSKTQVMTAVKHIQSLQNRHDESYFAYGEVQMKWGRKIVFSTVKGHREVRDYFHDGCQFLSQWPEQGRPALPWNAACPWEHVFSHQVRSALPWNAVSLSGCILTAGLACTPLECWVSLRARVLTARKTASGMMWWSPSLSCCCSVSLSPLSRDTLSSQLWS